MGDNKIRCQHQDDEIGNQKDEHQYKKCQNSSCNRCIRTDGSDKRSEQEICECQADAKEESGEEKQEGEVPESRPGTLTEVCPDMNIPFSQCFDKDELEYSVQNEVDKTDKEHNARDEQQG